MPNKMPYYQAGGPMTVKQRANRNITRDLDRDLKKPSPFEGIRGLVPTELHEADKKARMRKIREMRVASMRENANEDIRSRVMRDLNSRVPAPPQAPPPAMTAMRAMPRASGGILSFQTGGQPPAPTSRRQGYRPRALPQGYGGMAGYAGYGTPGEFRQRRSYVAPEVASQWADITKGVMDAGSRTYDDVRYKGPRLAGFTPQEAAYKAAATSIGTGQGPQATRQAEQTLGDAATGIGGVATAAGSPSLLKGADLSGYMSQYTQGAIDPQLRAIREAAMAQQSELGASAAQAGAFGGYRHGLQEQAIGQDMMQSIGDVTAKGYEQAFRSAQEAQQKDAQAEAAARAQQLGAYGQLTSVAGQEAALGSQQQRDEMARLDMMRDAGMDTRKMQQTAYDMQKAEHEQRMQYPERQLSFMSNMLQQTPYENIVSEGTYTPQASGINTMIGTGLSAQGMADQWGRQQNMQGPPPPVNNTGGTGQTDNTGMVGDGKGQGQDNNLLDNVVLSYGGGLLGLYGGGMMPRYGRP